jgi:hypothetical protein
MIWLTCRSLTKISHVRIIGTTWFCQLSVLVTVLCLALIACNRVPGDLSNVVLSYQENPTGCAGCPKFKVDFSKGGEVTFTGQRGCAVGVRRYHISETEFRELVDAFTITPSSAFRAWTSSALSLTPQSFN